MGTVKQVIPSDNLAYPTLITFDTGSLGSAFQLMTETHTFLVTAKHVLLDDRNNIRGKTATLLIQTVDPNEPAISRLDFDELIKHGLVSYHKDKDVAVILINTLSTNPKGPGFLPIPLPGVSNIKTSKAIIISVSSKAILPLSRVLISNDVFVYGYPVSLGLKQLPQLDYNKPLLRKGIVANVYPNLGTIILDCPIYYGNSGGPVVQVTPEDGLFNHYVIGVVSQFVPYSENWQNLSNNIVHTEISNSGYSVAVSMDYVVEIIKPYLSRPE